MTSQLTLVSHALCPYVQRATIVLLEKGVPFTRRDIDLANKPEWFLAISPLGKTPVLLADDVPVFESAVICEYLEDVFTPHLHPEEALQRARHRAWIEFGSSVLNAIASFFDGERFSIVDAAFGPVFRYFDVFDRIQDFGFFSALPKVQAWRGALALRPSVIAAVREDYENLLMAFLKRRGSALSTRIEEQEEARQA
jgi:glutathione S-transferase